MTFLMLEMDRGKKQNINPAEIIKCLRMGQLPPRLEVTRV